MLALTLALLGCAQKTDVDALTARVVALEEKVVTLEKRPAGPAGQVAADPVKEEAAGVLMKEASELLKVNDYAAAKPKLEQLIKDYGDTKAGKAADRQYKEVGLIGTPAAAIEAASWYQGKGDYSAAPVTLMVFWEIWCPHCKKEMPELAEREAELKKKGIQIVGFTKSPSLQPTRRSPSSSRNTRSSTRWPRKRTAACPRRSTSPAFRPRPWSKMAR